MIIGIDESGDFETDQFSISSAVFIRPGVASEICRVFEQWEKNLPDNVKEKGEVKGWKLSEQDLIDFVKNILLDNGYDQIRHASIAIRSSNEQQQHILKNRQEMLAKQIKDVEHFYRMQHNGAGSNFCNGMSGWIKGLKSKNYAKLEVLCIILFDAFRFAPIAARWSDCDRELGELIINIDNTIIGKEQTRKYWEKILCGDFWERTHKGESFIQFPEWKPDDPFVKRFIATSLGTGEVEYTEELQKCWNFTDSITNFEVRIADIVANILYRYYNMPSSLAIEEIVALMSQKWTLSPAPCKICEFTDKDDEIRIPSPFANIIHY